MQRILWVVLLLIPALAVAEVCGDADGSGTVTVTDGVNVLRASAQLSSPCSIATCDVDGSGNITVTDGVNVLRTAASLPSAQACSSGIVGCPTDRYFVEFGGARLGPGNTVELLQNQFDEIPAACDPDRPVTLRPTHVLKVQLLGPGGVPIAGPSGPASLVAQVRELGRSIFSTSAAPDADGKVALPLPDGTYHLHINTGCPSGLKPVELDPITIAGADVDLGTVQIESHTLFRLFGTVTNLDPVSTSVSVSVGAYVSDFGNGCTSTFSVEMAGGLGASVEYELLVPAADLQVRAQSGGAASGLRERAILTSVSGDTQLDLALEVPVVVTGNFTDPQGEPVSAGALAFWFSTDPSIAPGGAGSPAPPTDRFAVAVPPERTALLQVAFPSNRPPDGPNQLFPEDVIVGNGPIAVGTIVVNPGCLLAGVVADANGTPPSLGGAIGVYEYVRGPEESCIRLGAGFSVVDAAGRFSMSVLPGFGR